MKKNILLVGLLIISASLYANISDNVDTLYNVALNKDIGYLNAAENVDDALDNLDDDPLYMDSSLSINSKVSYVNNSFSNTTELSLDVPIADQLSLDAKIDTNLDGSAGFTYSPFVTSATSVADEINLENNSLYLEEYQENLKIKLNEAYLNYLISIEKLEIQEAQADLDKESYEQQKLLLEYDEATLTDVQDALFNYNDSLNAINTLELAVYKNRITLIELMGVENNNNIIIPETDINEIVDLVNSLDALLEENEGYSIMKSYDVVKALNTTITLEDSYDSLKLYNPTFSISGSVSTDGNISGSVLFKTSFNDYNGDEKDNLLDDIELAKAAATQEINLVQDKIDILEKEIESDEQQITSIKNQIEDNNYVMQEAASLLQLGEYEDLNYLSLQINENNLMLSLIEAYVALYINQLTLYNYL